MIGTQVKVINKFISLLQAFDQSELLECIRRLVEIDQDWVPHSDSDSLYIRPTFISMEVRGDHEFLKSSVVDLMKN